MLTSTNIQEYKDLDAQGKVNWNFISYNQTLSEDFIRKFQNKVNWYYISRYQKLTEDFIREFKDKVNWARISTYQKLSESFIREFQDQLNWNYISANQKLSEALIREFKDKVSWDSISAYQKLSEAFIREFQDQVYWDFISCCQTLSDSFIEEFKDKIEINQQKLSHHDSRTTEQKRQEISDYAKEWNLRFENDVLHAFRNHDQYGRGAFYSTISYKPGEYHRDWHCDLNPENENSFGLGILPKGNTPVEVKLEDWGVAVIDDERGKARVWAFSN